MKKVGNKMSSLLSASTKQKSSSILETSMNSMLISTLIKKMNKLFPVLNGATMTSLAAFKDQKADWEHKLAIMKYQLLKYNGNKTIHHLLDVLFEYLFLEICKNT